MEMILSLASTGLVLKHGKMSEMKLGDSTITYRYTDEEFRPQGSFVEIQKLHTPADKRGSGSARKLMEHFLNLTDRAGLEVMLEAEPMDAQTKGAKLVKFYKSFGFKSKGRGTTAMIRKAQ